MFFSFTREKVGMFLLISAFFAATFAFAFPRVRQLTDIDVQLNELSVLGGKFMVSAKTLGYKAEYEQFASGSAFLANLSGLIFGGDNPSVIVSNADARAIPALAYHGISNTAHGAVTVENFKKQMFALKKEGYKTITTKQFIDYVNGRISLPAKSFLLTFDDSRKDSYYPVQPLLEALDYHAVMFVITGQVGPQGHSPYYLSFEELRAMLDSGRWDIEVHTHSGHDYFPIDNAGGTGHFYVDKIWLADKSRIETAQEFTARISADLAVSKKFLEDNFHVNPVAFAYPFGDFGQGSTNFPQSARILADAAKSLFQISFYQGWPGVYSYNYPQDEDNFHSKRIEVLPSWSGADLLTILKAGEPKPLPYTAQTLAAIPKDWRITWGKGQFDSKGLLLSASGNAGTGAGALLDGSYLWGNYRLNADVKLISGQTFSLIVRYHHDDEDVACTFFSDHAQIVQLANGRRTVLGTSKVRFTNITGQTHTASASVVGSAVTCYLDGVVVANGVIDSPVLARSGGIAFSAWDQTPLKSVLLIEKFQVEKL